MTQNTSKTQAPRKEELKTKQLAAKAESTLPKPEVAKPEEAKVESAHTQLEKSTSNKPKPMSLADLQKVVEAFSKMVVEHTQQITEIQEALARKRKPVESNSKVKIKDKQTGKVYPSKNATYQTLLKAGELKELVDQGIFGDNPTKNTFGWYALKRALPDRFEELKKEEKEKKSAEAQRPENSTAESK
jgi:hypothetical protein